VKTEAGLLAELEEAKRRFYTREKEYADQDQIDLALRLIELVRKEKRD